MKPAGAQNKKSPYARHTGTHPVLHHALPAWRSKALVFIISIFFIGLALRALWVMGFDNHFYIEQGNLRILHTLTLRSKRGTITDRNGQLLATSLPMRTIWADPAQVPDSLPAATTATLSKLLDMPRNMLLDKLHEPGRFVYLKRQVPLDVGEHIAALDVPGISSVADTRRYYPEGEMASQLVGFTNIDGHGQDGVELAEDTALQGRDGKETVVKDRMGAIVQDISTIDTAHNGSTIPLSIDNNLQYVAFSALKSQVEASGAKAGAAIVIDAHTGEVLALANYPTFDPNNRAVLSGEQLRNRVMTDVFEPGSIMKPFTISLALDLNRVTPATTVLTTGRYVLDGATITDDDNFGTLTMGGVIQKSSNIGATKIAMLLKPREMWQMYQAIGLGQSPDLHFPGMGVGIVRPWRKWRRIEQATMSYGYGLSASLFQLGQAYTVFANNGRMIPLTIYKRTLPAPSGAQVFKPETVREVRTMLERVVAPGGTAPQAQVAGYSVGGKTGTAYTATAHGYDHSKYRASFVGLIPIRHPRLIIAVSVNQPEGHKHFGGDVSGPVFASIALDAMHTLNIPPDIPLTPAQQQAMQKSAKASHESLVQ